MSKNYAENLPPKFTRNISGLYGAKGEKWLADLPKLLVKISEKWSLTIEKPFANLSFNFVAPCVGKTGEKFVLKAGVSEENPPLLFEKNALKAFDGKGAVKVLRYDEKFCAMLLERAIEGKSLHEICGENYLKAVEIAVEVMKRLPRNPPNKKEFINLETWTDGLNRAVKINFAPEKTAKAQKFFAELAEPFEKKILLHGDIHFDNILSARRESFLLIDPKGVVGEIGYEIAVFLNDLGGWTEHLPNQKQILDSAVESFSKAFIISSNDLRKWCYAFAVLSAWWMMEDFGRDWETQILRSDIWKV